MHQALKTRFTPIITFAFQEVGFLLLALLWKLQIPYGIKLWNQIRIKPYFPCTIPITTTWCDKASVSWETTWASLRSGCTVLKKREVEYFTSWPTTIQKDTKWYAISPLSVFFLKVVDLLPNFQMTTLLWPTTVTNGATQIQINGVTPHLRVMTAFFWGH